MSANTHYERRISPEDNIRFEQERQRALKEMRKREKEAQKRAEKARKEAENREKDFKNWLQQEAKKKIADLRKIAQTQDHLAGLNQQLSKMEDHLKELSSSSTEVIGQLEQLAKRVNELHDHFKQTQLEWGQLLNEEKQNLKSIEKEKENTQILTKEVNDGMNALSFSFDKIQQTSQEFQKWADEATQANTEYNQIRHEIAFLDSNPSLSTSAFVTMQAMRDQGYHLRQAISSNELKAWFEHVDGKKRIEVSLRDAYHEGEIWLEQLNLFEFHEDECLKELEGYNDKLEDLGVRYASPIIRYPKPEGAESWTGPERQEVSTRHKIKN